jgi:hypothetical protein
MISIIEEEDRKNLSRELLLFLEEDVIVRLGFDFNYPCPI